MTALSSLFPPILPLYHTLLSSQTFPYLRVFPSPSPRSPHLHPYYSTSTTFPSSSLLSHLSCCPYLHPFSFPLTLLPKHFPFPLPCFPLFHHFPLNALLNFYSTTLKSPILHHQLRPFFSLFTFITFLLSPFSVSCRRIPPTPPIASHLPLPSLSLSLCLSSSLTTSRFPTANILQTYSRFLLRRSVPQNRIFLGSRFLFQPPTLPGIPGYLRFQNFSSLVPGIYSK